LSGRDAAMFIVLEGGDGAGKSTQVNMLAERLRRDGREVLTFADPGATALGERIHALISDNDISVTPEAELFLFQAARAEMARSVIKPALAEGAIALCDRFTPSTFAYQGAGHGLDARFIAACNDFAAAGLRPTAVILLDIDADAATGRLARAAAKTGWNFSLLGDHREPSRIERLAAGYRERVLASYREQAARERDSWRVVDARQAPAAVHERVWAAVKPFIDGDGGALAR